MEFRRRFWNFAICFEFRFNFEINFYSGLERFKLWSQADFPDYLLLVMKSRKTFLHLLFLPCVIYAWRLKLFTKENPKLQAKFNLFKRLLQTSQLYTKNRASRNDKKCKKPWTWWKHITSFLHNLQIAFKFIAKITFKKHFHIHENWLEVKLKANIFSVFSWVFWQYFKIQFFGFYFFP